MGKGQTEDRVFKDFLLDIPEDRLALDNALEKEYSEHEDIGIAAGSPFAYFAIEESHLTKDSSSFSDVSNSATNAKLSDAQRISLGDIGSSLDDITKPSDYSSFDEGKAEEEIEEQAEEDSWNFFNYEDDGQIIEEYNEGADFAWPYAKQDEVDSKRFGEDVSMSSLTETDKQELKKVLLSLDELFANLPEAIIKEFAMSPYYSKYNDILDKLGV